MEFIAGKLLKYALLSITHGHLSVKLARVSATIVKTPSITNTYRTREPETSLTTNHGRLYHWDEYRFAEFMTGCTASDINGARYVVQTNKDTIAYSFYRFTSDYIKRILKADILRRRGWHYSPGINVHGHC